MMPATKTQSRLAKEASNSSPQANEKLGDAKNLVQWIVARKAWCLWRDDILARHGPLPRSIRGEIDGQVCPLVAEIKDRVLF